MENGKVLALTDILAGDQTAIEKLIHDGFLAQAKADPDNHYVESDAVLTQAIADKKYGYYLHDTGLTIYFQQYAIAPYAAGFQEYTIPFSQTSTFNSNFLK